MNQPFVASLAFLLSLAPATAAWAAAEKGPSRGPWTMNYAPDSCRIAREFVTDAGTTTLIFERYRPDDQVDVLLAGSAFHQGSQSPLAQGLVSFSPDGARPEARRVMIGTSEPDGAALVLFGKWDLLNRPVLQFGKFPASAPTPAQEKAISAVTLVLGGEARTFELDTLGPPMAAMRECTNALVRDWGLDPRQQATLARVVEPLGNPGTWATDLDMPAAMRRQGVNAQARFRLMIDEKGKPTACYIQKPLPVAGLGALTCTLLLQRARFKPALDADRNPVSSYYVNAVNWISGP